MSTKPDTPKNADAEEGKAKTPPEKSEKTALPEEIGGRGGLDPVRYGDWEIGGKCVDF